METSSQNGQKPQCPICRKHDVLLFGEKDKNKLSRKLTRRMRKRTNR